MLLEPLRRLKEQYAQLPFSVYFVGSVQEELGSRGAHTAAIQGQPDLGLSLEAGIAGDYPGGRPELVQEKLGGGPVLYLADGTMLVNGKLRAFFEDVARTIRVPVQTEVTNQGTEDSSEIQRFGAGKPALNFAVPARYLHGHRSMVQRSDIDQAIDLL